MRTRIAELEARLKHSERRRHLTEQVMAKGQVSDSKPTPRSQEARKPSEQPLGTGNESIGESALGCGTQGGSDHHSSKIWTTVTTDVELVKQLHALYFSWEHAVCCLLSKSHFIADRESGRQRYCSPLLVNVLAALGCKFSGRPEVRQGFDNGAKFFLEAERIWETEQGDTSITTIQATALMSLWEASQGRHRRGAFYSRQALSVAVEGGLHRNSAQGPSEEEVRSTTFWGLFVLDQ